MYIIDIIKNLGPRSVLAAIKPMTRPRGRGLHKQVDHFSPWMLQKMIKKNVAWIQICLIYLDFS